MLLNQVKLRIKMKNMNLPKLFCHVGENLLLKRIIQIEVDEKEFIFEVNTKFKVIDIVGYGFDLLPVGFDEKYQIRVINSEMANYFIVC